jgi:hypothetical protein
MDNLAQEVAPASISDVQPSDTFSLTFAPQPNCMLLNKLPGELRNEIIRLAVVEDEEIKPKVSRSYDDTTSYGTAKLELDHALMRTCKQLRQESAEIYFLENTFRLTDDFFTLDICEQQHKANERAIQALDHAFGPWASKIRRLGFSHAVCYDSRRFGGVQPCLIQVEVHVLVCRRAQGESGVYLENARAHDAIACSQALCCCSVIQHAADNSPAGILEFVQGLVCMSDLVTGQRSLSYCWNCGLQPMA